MLSIPSIEAVYLSKLLRVDPLELGIIQAIDFSFNPLPLIITFEKASGGFTLYNFIVPQISSTTIPKLCLYSHINIENSLSSWHLYPT